jgi:hypothetical protein
VTSVPDTHERLRETDGFLVESPAGDLGWVEEVWVGETGEPEALAVRTADGQHGLLLGDQVLSVDRERQWVVVSDEPTLLELAPPRLTKRDDGGDPTLAANWTTTGAAIQVTPRPHRLWHLPYRPEEPKPVKRRMKDPPVWQGIAILLVGIALLVTVTIVAAFTIADLVT